MRTQLVDGLLADLLQDVRVLRVYSGALLHAVHMHAKFHILSQVWQQVVFALLVPNCQQPCNNLVDIIRLVTRLFQQVRYSHDITILLQPCVVSIRRVRTTLLQHVVTTTGNMQCEHNLSTAVVGLFVTTCLQTCSNKGWILLDPWAGA